jgi:TonB family protein
MGQLDVSEPAETQMTEAWKQWEGQVVNGEFHLRQYLGGDENSAVFLTEYGEQGLQAAIKLVPARLENAEFQLSQWGLAAKLSHPHLIRIFQMGRCQLGDMALLYVVMEDAEEDLSQILPQRALTPAEAREMLEPVLDALAYVHGQGFVHGHIKPANVMAVEDQLKISSDGLCRVDEWRGGVGKPGVYDAPEIAEGAISPAADVWSLGMTVVEALTQRLPVWEGSEQGEPVVPETLPAPFLEIARHCLRRDPQRRWTLAEIAAGLQQTLPEAQRGTVASPLAALAAQDRTAASPQAVFAKWRYVVSGVAVGLVLVAMLFGPKLFNRQRTPSSEAKPPEFKLEPAPKPVTPEAGQSRQRSDDKKQGTPEAAPRQTPVQSEAGPPSLTAGIVVPGKVVHQVLPDVPRSARATIQGRVKVGVSVRVDPSGNVAGAKLDSPGPSKYFAELALKAARHWKFDPAKVDDRNVPSEWILRFQFGRTETTVLPVRAAP